MFMFTYKAGFPMFAFFEDELEARKSLKAFCFTARIIIKYSLERFHSICGEKKKKSKAFFKVLYLSNLLLGEIMGAYHLTEDFGNSGWNVNGKTCHFSEIPTEN